METIYGLGNEKEGKSDRCLDVFPLKYIIYYKMWFWHDTNSYHWVAQSREL